MSNLEKFKDRLKQKPIVQPQKDIRIIIKRQTQDLNIDNEEEEETMVKEQVKKKGPVITAEKDQGQRAQDILEKIKQKKLTNVINKIPKEQKDTYIPRKPELIIDTKKKTKKINAAVVLQEDEEDQQPDFPEGGPRLQDYTNKNDIKSNLIELDVQDDNNDNYIDIATKKTNVKKQSVRTTKKLPKGVIHLGPEMMIKIGDTSLAKRLPPPEIYNVNVSSYYMNNRELFVNFVNSLFEPYKDDLLDETKGITCNDIGKDTGEISLLTHQKIVKDYINLHSPYRGLLLYHGLGSGKTCSSIAIAEGIKNSRKIIIMTPASLRRNYIEELKKCGDLLYRKNQYWEWISVSENPNLIDPLSASLGLPREYIRRNKGAWLINITKPTNYIDLSSSDKKILNDQIDEMIKNKYMFINYNSPRLKEDFKQLTNNFQDNIFDNAVVIIDEAHNLISRIVNKINKNKSFNLQKATLSHSISLILYDFLLKADNSRIVLLTGTPMINYPNEIGILFNILRGYIKTWKFTLSGDSKLSKDILNQIFNKEKILDYMDFIPSSKILTVTRNPYGFENKITETSGYKGITNEKKETRDAQGNTIYNERGQVSNDEFIKRIVKLLKKHNINAIVNGTTYSVNTALPDTTDSFIHNFINKETGIITNVDKFKRRIVGLTSYFRSAQEELLPSYDKNYDRHEVYIPMSDYQFKVYEDYRREERKTEKPGNKKKGGIIDQDGLFKEPSSTYRIFSRLACNFVMPTPPGRPNPSQFNTNPDANLHAETKTDNEVINQSENADIGEKLQTTIEKETILIEPKLTNNKTRKEKKQTTTTKTKKNKRTLPDNIIIEDENQDELDGVDLSKYIKELKGGGKTPPITSTTFQDLIDSHEEGKKVELDEYIDEDSKLRELDELEGDELLEYVGNVDYKQAIKSAINYLNLHSQEFLSQEGLKIYSPKFLALLDNIKDEEHQGLHLIYSQFRSMEGIGIFSMVLDANGFSKFKIKRTISTGWEIDMSEEDMGKPCYALYTGTEDAEEREILRNIYNGTWNYIPNNIATQLRAISRNNNLGEIIKVLMITSAGSEGINLKNTRYVHIMEPYWHPVRTEQVIGRARRICSHQELPKEMQTVEVFIYIMTITKEQLDSEYAIELKLKDLSKTEPYLPQTSDQKLFELSSIKEQLSGQLLKAIKESSIDCATHIKSSTKEGLVCLSFGNTNVNEFSYNPNLAQDENDNIAKLNKEKIDWEAREFMLKSTGKKYILRIDTKQVYDYDSVIMARQTPGVRPMLIGKLVKNSQNEYEIVNEII